MQVKLDIKPGSHICFCDKCLQPIEKLEHRIVVESWGKLYYHPHCWHDYNKLIAPPTIVAKSRAKYGTPKSRKTA